MPTHNIEYWWASWKKNPTELCWNNAQLFLGLYPVIFASGLFFGGVEKKLMSTLEGAVCQKCWQNSKIMTWHDGLVYIYAGCFVFSPALVPNNTELYIIQKKIL